MSDSRPKAVTSLDIRTLVDSLCGYLRAAIKANRAAATGEEGFEGLVAQLLRSLTGQSFHVAASGLQQSGDAVAHTGRISLQSKAYFGENQPTTVSILGDAEAQLNSNDELDVFVVALRELPAQKVIELQGIFSDHGIDLVCLQCTGDNPDLLCLLAHYWSSVCDHPLLKGMPSDLRDAIPAIPQSNPTKVDSVIQSLKARVSHADWTYTSNRKRSQKYLRLRFGLMAEKTNPGLSPIQLGAAITRGESGQGFREWWSGGKSLLFAVGEEGCGKSWLIANEVWRIADSDKALVLWLDSIQWESATSISEVVETAFFACLGIPDSAPDTARRLYRKIESRWTRPVLLVLDGMNERTCAAAAERIIGSCLGCCADQETVADDGATLYTRGSDMAEWRLPRALRMVFSTRPLAARPRNPASVAGEHAATFRVPPYTDNEFREMLSRNGLAEGELPRDTSGLLRFPRYFSVFLRVRKQIGSAEVITPALVWWYDLLAKIEAGLDPAITVGLKLARPTDAEDLLRSIAKELSTRDSLSLGQLNALFGGTYLDIRAELLDSRLFKESGRVSATVSDDHVALAWGLMILRFLQTCGGDDVCSLTDRIHQLLEPGLSDPRRTHGILIALQLSLTGEGPLVDPAIGAGLLAWFCSHNIVSREDQLEFWCRQRLHAYSLFVESLLVSPRAGSPERVAVAPLARLWRNGAILQSQMTELLRRWLLVTWSEGQPGNTSEHEWQGVRLPVVSDHVQLRLTPIAVSIISQRPDESLLPILALCHASAPLSTEIHDGKTYPTKWPQKMIEPLMRWAYTEAVRPNIEALLKTEDRPDVRDAYQWLISDGLAIAPSKTAPSRPGLGSVAQAIRENADPRTYSPDNPRGWVYGIELLAVRDDLPDLTAGARDEILTLFRACCDPKKDNIDRWFFEGLWPWALKLHHQVFEEACLGPLLKTLACDAGPNYEILHHFQGFLWQHQFEPIGDAIEACIGKSRSRLHLATAENLVDWLLFHGSEELLRRCLLQMENLRDERGHLLVALMSITELLQMLKPACIAKLSEEQGTSICSIQGWRDNTVAVQRLEYWLLLWANVTGEDQAAANWAIDLLAGGCPADCRHDCVRLLARSACSRLPSLIRNNHLMSGSLKDEDFVCMLRYGSLPELVARDLALMWADRGTQMLAHSGRLLLLREDDAGLTAWGRDLLELSCQCSTDPRSGAPAATSFELDTNGRITSRGPSDGRNKSTLMCLGPNAWGLDEGVQPGHVEDWKAQLDEWRVSEATLKKWSGYALREFSDEPALRRWAERHPAEFTAYCHRFFATVPNSPENAMKMGAFPDYLLAVMIRTDPAGAYAHWQKFRTISNSRVYTACHAELVPSAAWKADLNGVNGIDATRKAVLLDAKHDEAIMGFALSAVREGAEQSMVSICEEFLRSDLSKVRALAVSALAWLWQDSVDSILDDHTRNDPSCWIREHASWAMNVRRQDSACRRAYRRALLTTDEFAVSRQLHVMKPALLPSCAAWREMEEEAAEFPGHDCSPRKKAVIRHFWYHWDCVTNHRHDTRVLGRQMKGYLRGHKVDRLAEEQMAPWWQP